MSHLSTLITDMAVILILAGITTLICKKLKQPVIIGYVLAGFLASPITSFFPIFVDDAEAIETLAEIGVIFLMFSLGLEFNFHKMAQVGASGTVSATIQILGMVLLGYLIGILLGWSTTDSLFLGGMLSMSSTIITIKAIEDCGMLRQKFAPLAIGTLIIEDIAAIFLMLVLSTVSVSQGDGADLVLTIGKLLFFLAFWLVLGIFIVPTLIQKIIRLLKGETLLIVALGLCFGMVLIADAIGFSSALGAFLAGSLLSGTAVAAKTEDLIRPCKDLFVAVFFVSVGFLVVPSTLVDYALPILLLIIATVLGKVILLSVGYLLTRQDLSTSIHGALSQVQVGEFSFVIATLGVSLGVTSDFLYPVIVAVALLTTFLTPFLLRLAPALTRFLERNLPEKLLRKIIDRSRKEEESEEKELEAKILWRRFLKRCFLRVGFLTLIGAGLIVLGYKVFLPFAVSYLPDSVAKIAVMVLLFLLFLPILPQLMVSHDPDFAALWLESRFNRFPLILIMTVRATIGIGLLMLIPVTLFTHVPIWSLLLIIPVAIVAAHSRRLRGSYLTIAAKFLANLNERQLHEAGESRGNLWQQDNLLVDTYRIPKGSSLIDSTMAELRWGQTMHINMIRLIRGKKIHNFPSRTEPLREGDRISLYGTSRAMENFRLVFDGSVLERENKEDRSLYCYIIDQQDHIAERDQLFCYGTLIHKGSPFTNKSIRDSRFRDDRGCFVIGVERDMLPITELSSSFILRSEDIVWLLATVSAMTDLLQDETIVYHETVCTLPRSMH